ncbi:MAG: MFS transporter [Pseudomonadales bacterium]
MLALFVYQAGEMSAWAYVIELGTGHGLTPGFVSTAVAVSLWIGGPAALFVTWWSTRSGRWLPLVTSTLAMALSVALLLVPEGVAFVLANVGFGIFFSVSFPYLMGVASELDDSGQMGALAGFAGNLGLATGPALAALLIGGGHYQPAVLVAVPAIVFSLLLAARPARALDRMNRTGRVVW